MKVKCKAKPETVKGATLENESKAKSKSSKKEAKVEKAVASAKEAHKAASDVTVEATKKVKAEDKKEKPKTNVETRTNKLFQAYAKVLKHFEKEAKERIAKMSFFEKTALAATFLPTFFLKSTATQQDYTDACGMVRFVENGPRDKEEKLPEDSKEKAKEEARLSFTGKSKAKVKELFVEKAELLLVENKSVIGMVAKKFDVDIEGELQKAKEEFGVA